MLVEDLLSLPIGARVVGEVQASVKMPGVVASQNDGAHFIRWDDGYSTMPLGRARNCDEYLAARVELQPTPANGRRGQRKTS